MGDHFAYRCAMPSAAHMNALVSWMIYPDSELKRGRERRAGTQEGADGFSAPLANSVRPLAFGTTE
jgi:hypothetical protein